MRLQAARDGSKEMVGQWTTIGLQAGGPHPLDTVSFGIGRSPYEQRGHVNGRIVERHDGCLGATVLRWADVFGKERMQPRSAVCHRITSACKETNACMI